MAKPPTYLHIGLPHSGGERLDAALHEHRDAVREPARGGLRVASHSVDETFRAAVELRRDHKAWGLRRKDVEGVWAGIARRAHGAEGPAITGHPLLAGAAENEIDLTVDALRGRELHLLVSVTAPDARLAAFPDDHDLVDVLGRWQRAVRSPDRVHVLVTDPADPEPAWRQLGDLLGVDTSGLDVPPPRLGDVDTHALRLLAEGTSTLSTSEDLAAVAEGWAKLVADEGYDVRGDLDALVRATREPGTTVGLGGAEPALATLGEALSESVAEITRLRERALLLERENARLTRKKRRLKQRLADALG